MGLPAPGTRRIYSAARCSMRIFTWKTCAPSYNSVMPRNGTDSQPRCPPTTIVATYSSVYRLRAADRTWRNYAVFARLAGAGEADGQSVAPFLNWAAALLRVATMPRPLRAVRPGTAQSCTTGLPWVTHWRRPQIRARRLGAPRQRVRLLARHSDERPKNRPGFAFRLPAAVLNASLARLICMPWTNNVGRGCEQSMAHANLRQSRSGIASILQPGT